MKSRSAPTIVAILNAVIWPAMTLLLVGFEVLVIGSEPTVQLALEWLAWMVHAMAASFVLAAIGGLLPVSWALVAGAAFLVLDLHQVFGWDLPGVDSFLLLQATPQFYALLLVTVSLLWIPMRRVRNPAHRS